MSAEAEYEALLARVLAGELSEDDPRLRTLGPRGADLREIARELRHVQDGLDASARRARVLAEARAADWAEAEERMRALVALEGSRRRNERDRPRESREPTRRLPRWLLPTVAAAGLVWAALFLFPSGDRAADVERGPRVFLGAELPRAVPQGTSAAYTPFAWAYPAPPGWEFEVRVFDDSAPGGGAPGGGSPAPTDRDDSAPAPLLASSGPLTGPGWTPPDDVDVDGWPDRILWTLDVRRPDGVLAETFSVRAWRP